MRACVCLERGTNLTGLQALLCRYRRRQRESREERARAFEAVFEDPELELEEVATQARNVVCCRAGMAWCCRFMKRDHGYMLQLTRALLPGVRRMLHPAIWTRGPKTSELSCMPCTQDASAMRGLAQMFGRPWTRIRDTQVP